jgi:predicted deacylase
MRRIEIVKAALSVLLLALLIAGGVPLYRHRHAGFSVVPGPAVTRVCRLSAYCPGLKGTMADTDVYFLEGKNPGGKALIMANTHANEPAGLLASLIFLENAAVEAGTLIIIPEFNNSAGRNTRPGDGYPLYFEIKTDWGRKIFRYGNRDASPLDQWPDPDVYIHYPEKQMLSYIDIRNTNRTWPGRPDGPLMERVTFAAMELMRKEKVDIAIDLHGAETMFPVTNCIVAPDKSARIATLAALTVKAMEGFESHVEPSPSGFRGLSHREIGDYSDTLPFLIETPIPFLDQPTGPKTVKFLLDGKDPFLLDLAGQKKLFVPYDKEGWSIDRCVGQSCSMILEILRQASKKTPGRAVKVADVPRYAELVAKGAGHYFHDPKIVEN